MKIQTSFSLLKLLRLTLFVLALIFLSSGGLLLAYYQDNQLGAQEYVALRKAVAVSAEEAFVYTVSMQRMRQSQGEVQGQTMRQSQGEVQGQAMRQRQNGAQRPGKAASADRLETLISFPKIDELALKKVNAAYAGWIYLPGTPIDYPLVYPRNNQDYLKLSFEGKRRACGCLFFDAQTAPFTAMNTIIHGHNMKSGAMFGCLQQFLDRRFAGEHDRLYVYWQGGWQSYRLLSVYLVDNTDSWPYQTSFLSRHAFALYVAKALGADKRKICQASAGNLLECNHLLTLSTCHGKREKLIVQWMEM